MPNNWTPIKKTEPKTMGIIQRNREGYLADNYKVCTDFLYIVFYLEK